METFDPYRPPEGRVEDVPQGDDPQPLAERGKRLVARILDGLIFGVPTIVIVLVFGTMTDVGPPEWIFILMFVPAGIVFAVNLFLLAQSGQTLGKKALGVKIVRLDRSPAGLGRIFVLRMLAPWLLGFLPVLGYVFGLANVLFIFREDRRCIHDWMADTVVVRA